MSDSALVVKEGVTYGTAVTPDRTFCVKSEGLNRDPKYTQAVGRCWGTRGPSKLGRVLLSDWAKGPIELELSTVGFGFWWKMCLGSSTSTLVSGTVYQQVHSPATAAFPFFTAQKLVQSHSDDGVMTTQTQTYDSLTVVSWELTIPESGIATLKVETLGHGVVTTTAAVTPSARDADDHFLHTGGASLSTGTLVPGDADALTTAPTAVAGVRSLTIKCDNGLIDRRTGWANPRPAVGSMLAVTGTLEVENITGGPFIAAAINGTALSLLAKLEALENSDELVQIAIPGLVVTTDLPTAGDPDKVSVLKVPFEAMLTGADSRLIYVETRTYDTTI